MSCGSANDTGITKFSLSSCLTWQACQMDNPSKTSVVLFILLADFYGCTCCHLDYSCLWQQLHKYVLMTAELITIHDFMFSIIVILFISVFLFQRKIKFWYLVLWLNFVVVIVVRCRSYFYWSLTCFLAVILKLSHSNCPAVWEVTFRCVPKGL